MNQQSEPIELVGDSYEDVEDVVVMPELNEEIILKVLHHRYDAMKIYTNAGNVLMAVNPFCSVPMYTNTVLNMYRKAYLSKFDSLAPHPWKTTAKAYIHMFGDDRQTCNLTTPSKSQMRPQSIIVSGESGAGKTETTKIIMAFLAKVSSLNQKRESLGTIQYNVLEANTILDAIGNARTMRNDNSSRYGKYVKLYFNNSGELTGAGMETFLLETTRVVRRNIDQERNFHIFYLMCSESSSEQRKLLKLRATDSYSYLNSSNVYDRRDGVKDVDQLQCFKTSMEALDIDPDDLQSLWKCFSAILTVGNVKFSSRTTSAGNVEIDLVGDSDQFISDVAELLEISRNDLLHSFTSRTMNVAGEQLDVTLDDVQAEELRDIFAKTLYSVVFAWIIEFLNNQLAAEDDSFQTVSLSSNGLPEPRRLCRRASSKSVTAGIDQFGSRIRTSSDTSNGLTAPGVIGILDIFGFEKQVENGLEQLLINFANETLQKQYDEVMIDAEQDYYAKEDIEWDFIRFPSNKDCIDLIANKRSSVLTLLDEACLAPSGSDSSFVHQIYNVLGKHKRLHLTSRIQANQEFGIKHYAGTVVYAVSNFVGKNKNKIFPLSLLTHSTNDFVVRLGNSSKPDSSSTKNSSKFLTATISNSFKKSVAQLTETIDETQAHYIKCIKPNTLNVKRSFMVDLVSEQLRCNGIMQTIVVTRCGFPIRLTYGQFHDRYYSLMKSLLNGKDYSISDGVDVVVSGLHHAIRSGEINFSENLTSLDSVADLRSLMTSSRSQDSMDADGIRELGIQRGKTRVFMRYNEFGALEQFHDAILGTVATRIQKCFRGYATAKEFKRMKRAACRISRAYRSYINNLILLSAVIIIQDFFRTEVQRAIVQKKRSATIIVQALVKFRVVLSMKKWKAAVAIQEWWKSSPSYVVFVRKAEMAEVFSPVISQLQKAVRTKLLFFRRIRELDEYRRDMVKEAKRESSANLYSSPEKSRRSNRSPVPESFRTPDEKAPFVANGESHSSGPEQPVISCRNLFKANSTILWTIFAFYSKDKTNIPGNTTPIAKRNSTRLVTASGIINLLKDWSLVPSVITQYRANQLLKEKFSIAAGSCKLLSFSNFISFLSAISSHYGKKDTVRLKNDGPYQLSEDALSLRHIFTTMNKSDGRSKFSQSRNACLVPSFVGIEGSEEALQVYLESQSLSSSPAPNGSAPPAKSAKPSFREIEMCDAVQALMRKNESTLISLALRYCPPIKTAAATTTPGSKRESRKSHVMLSFQAIYNLLHDFEVCPGLCSKSNLIALFDMTISENQTKGLNYSQFIDLLDHVAQNCVFGTKRLQTPENNVRTMFHHMNQSRGRAKLNRDPNSLIINPLTGLESSDPNFQTGNSQHKHVASKVTAMLNTPEKERNELSPPRRRLPMEHYHHLRTIKTPPRPSQDKSDEKPEWNFR